MAVTNKSFSSAVDAWTRKSEDRMERVFRESCQRLINEVQGNVPVDTGYLRSSSVATEGAPTPMRADAKGQKGQTYTFVFGQTATVLAGLKVGQTFFFCYTAVYARVVEFRRGYVRLAAQKWKSIVREVVAEAKGRAAGG